MDWIDRREGQRKFLSLLLVFKLMFTTRPRLRQKNMARVFVVGPVSSHTSDPGLCRYNTVQ